MPKTPTSRINQVSHYYSSHWDYVGPSGQVVPWDTRGYRLMSAVPISGYNDPDWRVKVKKHVDASSDYLVVNYKNVFPRRNFAVLRSSYWNSTWKRFDIFIDTWREYDISHTSIAGLTVTDNDIRDIALKRFKNKLSGRLGNAESLIPAVELREMRGLIRESASLTTKTLGVIDDLVRKHRGAKLLSHLSKAWLTYSFGVKPLVNDTIAAVAAVSNYFDRPTKLLKISASAKREWVNGKRSDIPTYHSWNIIVNAMCHNTIRYTYSGGIKFDLVCGNNYGIMEHLGFSDFWEQLPALGWELTPFSWVADYFTTVGDYLGDTFVLPPGSTVYLTQTAVYTGDFREIAAIQQAPDLSGDHQILGQQVIPGSFRMYRVHRVPLNSLPHRSLRFKSVDEVGKSAVNKLLNLCSILGISAARRARS